MIIKEKYKECHYFASIVHSFLRTKNFKIRIKCAAFITNEIHDFYQLNKEWPEKTKFSYIQMQESEEIEELINKYYSIYLLQQ